MSTATKQPAPKPPVQIPERFELSVESSDEDHDRYDEIKSEIAKRYKRVYEFYLDIDEEEGSYGSYEVYRGNGKYYVVSELYRDSEDFMFTIEAYSSKEDVVKDFAHFLNALKGVIQLEYDAWEQMYKESGSKLVEKHLKRLKKRLKLVDETKPEEELRALE